MIQEVIDTDEGLVAGRVAGAAAGRPENLCCTFPSQAGLADSPFARPPRMTVLLPAHCHLRLTYSSDGRHEGLQDGEWARGPLSNPLLEESSGS